MMYCRLDGDGLELLGKLLQYNAKKRTSAREAMKHTYFLSLGAGVHHLKDSEYNFVVTQGPHEKQQG